MLIIDTKLLLFLQIIVVIGMPLLLWRQFRLHHFLPLPIVQIFAGIALGPSIFGAISPAGFEFLFRKEVLSGVETLAQVALVLFVFLAGCEADRNIIRNSAGTVLKIGTSGVLLPWILGGLAAWALMSALMDPANGTGLIGRNGNSTLAAVSIGLAMSVTALPVLVVVMRELGFNQRPIGSVALALGGFDDAVLWLSVACLLPFAAGEGGFWAALAAAFGGGIIAVLFLLKVAAPFLQKLIDRQSPEALLVSLGILVLFATAGFTELTGLHAAVGAFLTGLLLPDHLRYAIPEKFDMPVSLLLLPFFFLSTGLKTHFDFSDPVIWLVVVITFAVSVLGKFAGVSLPARLSGNTASFSITLGILMQCKGLMEIVIVTILNQRGIIGDLAFSALVLVALLSTASTAPAARLCQRVFGDSATETAAARPPEVITAPAESRTGTVVPELAPSLVFRDTGERVVLSRPELIVGRHSEDDIRVKDVRVSRRHARLAAQPDGTWGLENLTAGRSEPNVITVNDTPREQTVLRDGDLISLGGVLLTFWNPGQPGAKAA